MSNATQSLAGTRITSLLDANSFVEIGQGVTARSTDFNMTANKAPSDGVITGYGVIDDKLVYVYSQDASVLNGTVGEMHAKKITRLYDLAMKTGAPVIGLVDCAGIRLQEATDALEASERSIETDTGIRCDPADHSNLRNMRRWYGSYPVPDRFHIHGIQKSKIIRQHTKRTGRKQHRQMRHSSS